MERLEKKQKDQSSVLCESLKVLVGAANISEINQQKFLKKIDEVDEYKKNYRADSQQIANSLLFELADIVTSINPRIFDADDELKRQARSGEVPEILETLTEEEREILTLFRDIRSEVTSANVEASK